MKLLRTTAIAGLAHRAFVEARKPANQARLKQAAAKVRSKQTRKKR